MLPRRPDRERDHRLEVRSRANHGAHDRRAARHARHAHGAGSGQDIGNARIVWEARDQEPAFGATSTISPKSNGAQWVEVEIERPDGRRSFAASTFMANSPVVTWVAGELPAGANPGAGGGDG